jgi:DNA-binding NtrC family response regulator
LIHVVPGLVPGLQQGPGVSARLLVVDDDASVRRTYESHFGRGGFEVHAAATLQQAAELLSTYRFDAVIADACLTPGVGAEGLAVAAYLRSGKVDPPVVVITAYGAPDHAEAAARLGADAFLHKPVSLVWLEGLLRDRIDGRHRSETEPLAAAG